MHHTDKHARPSVAADIVLMTHSDEILLIQRKHAPFKDSWALPGGFVDIDERSIDAAYRELYEETGISQITLKRLDVFDAPERDPRGRVISIAYVGIIEEEKPQARAADDAKAVRWFKLDNLPALAFDHADMIKMAMAQQAT